MGRRRLPFLVEYNHEGKKKGCRQITLREIPASCWLLKIRAFCDHVSGGHRIDVDLCFPRRHDVDYFSLDEITFLRKKFELFENDYPSAVFVDSEITPKDYLRMVGVLDCDKCAKEFYSSYEGGKYKCRHNIKETKTRPGNHQVVEWKEQPVMDDYSNLEQSCVTS